MSYTYSQLQLTFTDTTKQKCLQFGYGSKIYRVYGDWDASGYDYDLCLGCTNLDGSGFEKIVLYTYNYRDKSFIWALLHDETVYSFFFDYTGVNTTLCCGRCNLSGEGWTYDIITTVADDDDCYLAIIDPTNGKILFGWERYVDDVEYLYLASCNLDLTGFSVLNQLTTSATAYSQHNDMYIIGEELYYVFWYINDDDTELVGIGKSDLDGSSFTYITNSYSIDWRNALSSALTDDDTKIIVFTVEYDEIDETDYYLLRLLVVDVDTLTLDLETVLLGDTIYRPANGCGVGYNNGTVVYAWTEDAEPGQYQLFTADTNMSGVGFVPTQRTFTEPYRINVDDMIRFNENLYMAFRDPGSWYWQLWFGKFTFSSYAQANCIAVNAILDAHTGELITPIEI